MNRDGLTALVDCQPRAALAHLPTPLERHGDLLVKRDDQTGLAFGGSKLRALEFFVGEALRRRAKVLVVVGSPQSNFCRLTAAVAARQGLQCRLLIVGNARDGHDLSGNRWLSSLFGAELIPVDSASARETISDYLSQLQRDGVPFYFIEGGGHAPEALWGYLQASVELLTQLGTVGTMPDRLFVACGRGTTYAGFLLGLRLLDCPIPITGVSVARDQNRCRSEIHDVIDRFCRQYGLKNPVVESDIWIDDRWIGPGYDAVPPERWRIIVGQARRRGLLLDPIYTSRAMQAVLESVHRAACRTALFIHTGGLPGLFDVRLAGGLESIAEKNSLPVASAGNSQGPEHEDEN